VTFNKEAFKTMSLLGLMLINDSDSLLEIVIGIVLCFCLPLTLIMGFLVAWEK
jgi:hypothetical protein